MNDNAGLDRVQVTAPPGCEEDARRFYGTLLGMREVPRPAEAERSGGCCFECGLQQVRIDVAPGFRPAKLACSAICVADRPSYEALLARLTAAGVVVKHDPEATGALRFFTGDPWGNRLVMMLPLAS